MHIECNIGIYATVESKSIYRRTLLLSLKNLHNKLVCPHVLFLKSVVRKLFVPKTYKCKFNLVHVCESLRPY